MRLFSLSIEMWSAKINLPSLRDFRLHRIVEFRDDINCKVIGFKSVNFQKNLSKKVKDVADQNDDVFFKTGFIVYGMMQMEFSSFVASLLNRIGILYLGQPGTLARVRL